MQPKRIYNFDLGFELPGGVSWQNQAKPGKAQLFELFSIFISMKNVQTIIFDLGGVIINTKTDKEWLEEDLLPNFDKAALEKLFIENFFKHFETGVISTPEFIRIMKTIAVDKEKSVDKIREHWNGILLDIPQERIDLLHSLKNKYRLILSSNTNAIHLEEIQKYMGAKFGEDVLENTFHKCYYSHKMGIRKPHKEYFEMILEKEKLTAANCLFLDDRPENLVEPSKLGIPTTLVDKDITQLLAEF
jgi:putative hydrolase of the HAD superfamily